MNCFSCAALLKRLRVAPASRAAFRRRTSWCSTCCGRCSRIFQFCFWTPAITFRTLLRYRDRLVDSWRINLVNVASRSFPRTAGDTVRRRSTGRIRQQCCRSARSSRYFERLENYSVWFTGLRREQSPTRANLQMRGDRDTALRPLTAQGESASPLAVERSVELSAGE